MPEVVETIIMPEVEIVVAEPEVEVEVVEPEVEVVETKAAYKLEIPTLEMPTLYEEAVIERPNIEEFKAEVIAQPIVTEEVAAPGELTQAEKLARIALIEADLGEDLYSSEADFAEDPEDEFAFDLDLIDATVVDEEAWEPEEVAVELDTSRFGFVVYDAGTGDRVERGNKVKVDYVGTFLDGEEFDSSRIRGPFEFNVGQGNAIKCWDFALLQMHVGDKAKLNCPANTAYGERGNPSIPGGATIQFDIHVIAAAVDEATQEKFVMENRRAMIRNALRSDQDLAREQEIARLRARTKSFALTSIEDDLREPEVEAPKQSAIEKLDVSKLETDFLSFAKRAAPVVEEPEEFEAEADENLTAEQIAKKNRIAALIAKQQNFKLQPIGEEDNMYASGTNTESDADIITEAKAAAQQSQFSDEEVAEDSLMAKLRRIEAEALAAK